MTDQNKPYQNATDEHYFYMVQASYDQLCHPLPNNWQDMTEEKIFEHIDGNVVEHLEYHEPEDVFQMIDGTARMLHGAVQQQAESNKEAIVHHLGEQIRDLGFACVIFSPEEFEGTTADVFQNLLTEAGNEIAGEL